MEDLSKFPRPNVAVDIAVLTVLPSAEPHRQPGKLAVLVQLRADQPPGWALPGRFLREGESIQDTIRVALLEKAGLDAGPAKPRLLRVFDSPDRDPRGWTLSIGHSLALPPEVALAASATFVAADEVQSVLDGEPILFDHETIVREAAVAMRSRYEVAPDPDRLLGSAYSLGELQQVHEAVLGEFVQRDTFRRRMTPHLEPAMSADHVQLQRVDGGRPANLWTSGLEYGAQADATRLRLPRATTGN